MSRVGVLGLGIAGSAAAAALALAGHEVVGIEQFDPLHERGSSHGDTRIYRRVPHEGEAYFGLATTAWQGWRDWGRLAGEDLLVACGGLHAGPPGHPAVARCETLCREHAMPCEMLTGRMVNARHPHYALPDGWEAAFQPDSGFVRPDATRLFLHRRAREAGARLLFGTRAAHVEPTPAGIALRAGGERIVVDRLVVAAGAWLPRLLPGLPVALAPERRVIAWFRPETPAPLADGRLPIFILGADGGWYGMPTPDGRLKLGHDKHLGQPVDPDAPTMQPDGTDAEFLARCVRGYFRGFDPAPEAMRACIYTLSPDKNFTIDRHPEDSRIILLACCSGHGFKYAPAYGQVAQDLVEERPRPDLAAFALGRTQGSPVRF